MKTIPRNVENTQMRIRKSVLEMGNALSKQILCIRNARAMRNGMDCFVAIQKPGKLVHFYILVGLIFLLQHYFYSHS